MWRRIDWNYPTYWWLALVPHSEFTQSHPTTKPGCTSIYCNLWFCGRFVFADGCWAIFYLFPHTKKMGVAVQIEVQTLQPFVVSLTVPLSNTPPSLSNNLNSSAIRHSCYFFKCQHFSDCCGVRTTLPYSLFHQNPTKCCQSILPKATFLQTSN